MPGRVYLSAARPIGETDIGALLVMELRPAVRYDTQCLSFALVSRDGTTPRLRRDDVKIGLAVDGQDPEQASCRHSGGDVHAIRREYDANGIGMIDEKEYDGKSYRACFTKESYGVYFCFAYSL